MPRTKAPPAGRSRAPRAKPDDAPDPHPTCVEASDALYRSAAEVCRQHDRLSRQMQRGAPEAELQALQQVVVCCNQGLLAMTSAYEASSGSRDGAEKESWHRANALWHASREYARRHDGCDHVSRYLSAHDQAKLTQLAMEYELAASALLALHQAVDAYRKLRPGAD
jgi:hypothetical protein